jgi:hypothetical protein
MHGKVLPGGGSGQIFAPFAAVQNRRQSGVRSLFLNPGGSDLADMTRGFGGVPQLKQSASYHPAGARPTRMSLADRQPLHLQIAPPRASVPPRMPKTLEFR